MKIKKYLNLNIILLFVFAFCFCFGFKKTAYSQVNFKAKEEIKAKLKQIQTSVDSLALLEEDSVLLVRKLIQFANMQNFNANYVDAINYGKFAITFARELKRPDLELPALGLVYYTYLNIGIAKKANEYLMALEALNKEVKSTKVQLYIHLSKASSYIEENEFSNVFKEVELIENLLKNNPEFQLSPDEEAQFYQLHGITYFKMDKFDSSAYYYDRAINTFEHDSTVYVFTKIGIAELAIENEEYQTAQGLLADIKPLVDSMQDFRMQEYFLEVGIFLAEKREDKATALENHSKLNQLKDKRNRCLKDIANLLLEEQDILNKKSNKLSIEWYIVGMAIVVLFVVLFISNKQRKNLQHALQLNKERYKDIELHIKEGQKYFKKVNKQSEHDGEHSVQISEETISHLLDKLNQFENKKGFLEKDISLSKLAGQLKTNNKYLSQVINSHKNTDFNTYINTLRILYIVDKLKNNPEYLEYKIAYLAKESGFTTHSRFSAVFKEITGESPSEFIKKQQDETYLK